MRVLVCLVGLLCVIVVVNYVVIDCDVADVVDYVQIHIVVVQIVIVIATVFVVVGCDVMVVADRICAG